jgi:DUF1680 family protein
LDGGSWGSRQELNSSTIIPHCHAWETRLGWIDNFRDPHGERGREFADSDVYKMVEAMDWDGSFDTVIEDIASKMADAQEEDGYLNTRFGHRGREHRYTDLEWGHELYCYGHMIQAALARLRTRGEDRFTEVTRRAADHVCEAFGEAGNQGVCGHPEIEMALVELFRLTGEERYLEQARRCSSSGAAGPRWPTSSAAARTSRTTCRSGMRRPSAATPSARSTWRAERSTSRSRPATPSCWRSSSASGSARSSAVRT